MLILMRGDATTKQTGRVLTLIEDAGWTPFVSRALGRRVIAFAGEDSGMVQAASGLPGVESVQPLGGAKLSTRAFRSEDTVVRIGGRGDCDAVEVGGGSCVVMAGPCSVESRELLIDCAISVRASGAKVLRGGAFKPRTSPHSFQGLGIRGLEILAEARQITRLPVVTEVLRIEDLPVIVEHADLLQIGTRNMQNFPLLRAAGETGRPVLLKRGMMATIDELLMAAEYILATGNDAVILCERGIRTFEPSTRSTLDVAAIPVLKLRSHLPVIIDPSHAAGRRDLVTPLALAGVAAGADGLLVEVHPEPDAALTDAEQALALMDFKRLMEAVPGLLSNRENGK